MHIISPRGDYINSSFVRDNHIPPSLRKEEKCSFQVTMKIVSLPALCLLYLFLQVFYQDIRGDVYLHQPRGSNDRLKGENANRDNANRVFDSQNNAKGGYNVPEKTQQKSDKDWFEMQYYMSGIHGRKTILPIEWTNQHGCGDHDLNCNIVLQYRCQPASIVDQPYTMRNGDTEDTPNYEKKSYQTFQDKKSEVGKQVKPDRVINEPWEWYDKCNKRERNKGLFTADQNLNGDTSRFTRQNAAGTQYGHECPEERDYYPYWHPTGWKDIAVLVKRISHCRYYRHHSFNTNCKGECLELYNNGQNWHETNNPWRHASQYNNRNACVQGGGKWIKFNSYLEILSRAKGQCNRGPNGERLIWGIPYRSENIDQLKGEDPEQWKQCLVALAPPDCRLAPYSRSNHLGNGKNARALTYLWKLPRFPSGEKQRCVLRIRYNISTNDFNYWRTYSDSNNKKDVIENDPDVEIGQPGNNKVPLQLAINTAQFGRTFQDRSHIFNIIPRENHFQTCTIINVNVRGKRGNIVQAYPAVEYDFAPKRLRIRRTHCLHIQWAGSNRNPANNAGEGRAQTDRSNMVSMAWPSRSYPLTSKSMFARAQVIHAPNQEDYTKTKNGADIQIAMATSGHFKSAADVPSPFSVGGCDAQQAQQLDCYPPSYSGLLLKISRGRYFYMCSRNNNFTNRSQKGRLYVH